MAIAVLDDNGNVLQLLQPQPTHKTLAVSGVSAQSAALGDTTDMVELYCDTLCFVAVGADPTALVTGIPIYEGRPRTLKVTPGSKLAAITAGGTDTLRIVEMV